ncbi:RHS repeat domain-containing protein [Pseudomonas kitaguniensis]|uniref:RHS repeat domain-containing protein n=1 Tax=Pseudomonas kitaguniensis TaxID=2607908 RepID=UPI003D03A56B
MAHNPMGKDPADYESEPIFNATTQKINMVNTRTGLFEAYLKMLPVNGNSGSGPLLGMDMFYSPLTNNQAALGDGWEFSFTVYSEEYKKLTLNTGETLALEKDKDLKQPAVIAEWGADGKLTVYRKGGRTEVLSKLGDSLFYFPESLTTDGYNYLNLTWVATPHVIDGKTYYQTKLQRVTDRFRTLLEIDYTVAEDNALPALTPVILTYWPDDPTETLRYELTIEDYALKAVALADDIKTTFKYLDHKTAGWLLNKFTSSDGLVEDIEYKDNGLTFPNDPTLSALPCVSDHYVRPNGGGKAVYHFYEYDRSSNLKTYITTKFGSERRTAYTYDYTTNEILSEVSTHSTAGKSSIITTSHTISSEPNALKNERSITYSKDSKTRKIDIQNRFNKDAALIENRQRNKLTTYQYADGAKFLSDQPTNETVKPATILSVPLNTKTYTYTPVAGMSEPKLSTLTEIFDPSNIINPRATTQHFAYFVDNDFRKGKPFGVTHSGNAFRLPKRHFNYTLGGVNNSELTTETIDSVPSELSRVSSYTQSTLSGRLIRQVDIDDNRAEYTYDAFARLATLTVCAQSPTYKQTTTYAYPAPGQVLVTEPNGQVRLSEYDGQDRLIREYEYTTAGTQRLVKEVSYDNTGRELRSTQYDYTADGAQVSDWSELNYDDWGEVSGRRYSDGQQVFNQYDPIAMTRAEWSGKASDKHRKVTTYNVDETIQKITWLGQTGAVFQTQTATYTNAQRLERLRTNGEFGVTTISYTYDVFGRVLTDSHVENDIGVTPLNLLYNYHYTYALNSSSDKPATIEISVGPLGVSKRLLGKRTFDEWERVTSLTRGNSTETSLYRGVGPSPFLKTTADGIELTYEYMELGNKPSKVSTADPSQQKHFTYAHARQSLATASEGEQVLQYNHDLNLRITQQHVQTQPGEAKTVSSRYSNVGRLLSGTDVLEHSTQFEYNPKGQRTRSVNTHDTSCTYTDQGQLKEEVVTPLGSATTGIKVVYTYDAEQREINRQFVPVGNPDSGLEITTTYYADGRFKLVQLKKGSAVQGSRSFTYSAGGQLKSCTTTGVWRPKNPKGKLIGKQDFTYDGSGNVTRCASTFIGGSNTATYTYDSLTGVRLEKITNTHEDYIRPSTLTYDACGRVTQDPSGKKYTYDWLGRLIQAGSTRYSYDASDRLMTQGEGSDQRQFIYNEMQANGEYAPGNNEDYLHLEPGSAGCTVQLTRISGVNRTLYEWRDLNGTVWCTYDAQANTTKFQAYSPYGERSFFEDNQSLLGTNGELYDATIGQYPLGCGYRFLNPETRQFNAPDALSPFGIGGPNAYGYCTDSDPINFQDPSGHFSVSKRLRETRGDELPGPLGLGNDGGLISTIIYTAIGVLTAVMTGGASLWISISLVVLAVVSATLAVVSVLIADSDPGWSEGLAWASLVFGVFGGAVTLGRKLAQRAALFVRFLGNSTRAVGKAIFERTAVLSAAQKTLLRSFRDLENIEALRSLRFIEPYPFNTRALIRTTTGFQAVGDLNTVTCGVTGALSITSSLSDSKDADDLNTYVGVWFPNGSWKTLWNLPLRVIGRR